MRVLAHILEQYSLSLGSHGRLLGIIFLPDDRPSPPPAGWIGEVTGAGSWELPQSAVLVIGPGRVTQSLQVIPDWLDRPESDEILARLR